MVTDVKMVKYLSYTVLILLTIFLSGCGYDTALRYKTKSSVSYRLKITSGVPQQASSDIKRAFKDEGMEPTFYTDYGPVESYAFFESGNNTTITLYHDEGYKIAVVAIYPARLNSLSSKRRAQLKKREEAILRIEKKLIQTDSFAEK